MTIWAVMRMRFEGIHNYPDAPDEVSFLKHPHRHVFHVTVHLQQFHDNRDVEYIMFLTWLRKKLFSDGAATLNHMSCEMIAKRIIEGIQEQFPSPLNFSPRRIKVEVSEDGENGALVEN